MPMSRTPKTTLRVIDREQRRINISTEHVVTSYPLNTMPDMLFQRLANLTDRRDDNEEGVHFIWRDPITKPSLCTTNQGMPFSLNYAPKLVRLTLTDDVIAKKIDEIEGAILALLGKPFDETTEERLRIYKELFVDESKVDRFRLGIIEMYGTATYTNILSDPRACLGFSWIDEKTLLLHAIQLNCIAEIVEPDDPFYRYMRALRGIFSSRYVDLRRPEYVCAYKMWISEVKPKHLEDRHLFAEPKPDKSD